jgi:catechol 2,3-dioxygenase-like lactoylglutathione lyase family enzyme
MLHAVYRVGKLEETVEYYKKHFGMKVLRARDIPEVPPSPLLRLSIHFAAFLPLAAKQKLRMCNLSLPQERTDVSVSQIALYLLVALPSGCEG